MSTQLNPEAIIDGSVAKQKLSEEVQASLDSSLLHSPQTLTQEQMQQACGNIGAMYASETNGKEYPSVTIN